MCSWLSRALLAAAMAIPGLVIIIVTAIDMSNQIQNQTTYATVGLVGARGLDVDEQTRTNPVEFDLSKDFLHLTKDRAVGHDGGHIAISYHGIRMAEGQVPKFFVAGGPEELVEATRVVASAGKDQAPLSQTFRDHLWVDQQMDGEAVFDVALSFYDVDAVTGETTRSYHDCRVGFALHGNAEATKCGKAKLLT